jgi:hypothetical protein
MYITNLNAATLFYRVIGPGRHWNDVLAGRGAYFGRAHGGRYNRSRQKTVYASTDPLVAITEYAFYEALRWQEAIGTTALQHQHQLPPFRTAPKKRPRLWSFHLTPPPTILDVTDPAAFNTFHHPPYVLVNPSSSSYVPTQDLMDAIFHHPPLLPGNPIQGVQAPSMRTPPVGNNRRLQQVFVLAAKQNRLPGVAVDSWDLDIEFLDAVGAPVTIHATAVNWHRPRFQLYPRGGAGAIPALVHAPGGIAVYQPNVWHSLEIIYA